MGFTKVEGCVDGRAMCQRVMELGGTVNKYRRWRDDGRIKVEDVRVNYQLGHYYYKYFFRNEELEKITADKIKEWQEEDRVTSHERRVAAAKKAAQMANAKRNRNRIRKAQIEQEYQDFKGFSKIILDTETTGLEANDEILELAIIDCETGKTIFHHFFRPAHKRSWSEAEAIHGIRQEDVSECYPISVYRTVIQKILHQAKEVIGYNISFDVWMLKNAGFEICGKKVDVMEPFAEIYGEWSSYYGTYKWQKLTTCARHYGYDWGKNKVHGALADACATRFCWIKMSQEES